MNTILISIRNGLSLFKLPTKNSYYQHSFLCTRYTGGSDNDDASDSCDEEKPLNAVQSYKNQEAVKKLQSLLMWDKSDANRISKISKAEETHFEVKQEEKNASEEALNKLNDLLTKIVNEDTPKSKLSNLPFARAQLKKKKPIKRTPEKLVDELREAAKDVAKLCDDDTGRTESELLAKLIITSKTANKVNSSKNLADIVSGMQVEHEQNVEQMSRAAEVRRILSNSRLRSTEFMKNVTLSSVKKMDSAGRRKTSLFGGERLGIFNVLDDSWTSGPPNHTWEKLLAEEMKTAIKHYPNNYFQEMIQWTEQGKLWHFPIDNEQGMEVEQNVPFSEHVFLEKYLDSWCPKRGPIRHYMEVMCVGLSKNPYMPVEMKREHILWHKEYFSQKQKLLVELNAISQEEATKLSAPVKSY